MSGFGGDTNNFGGGGGFGTPLANNSNSNSNNNNNNNNNPFGGGGFGGSSGTTNATPLFGSGSGFGSGGGDALITSFASAVPFGGSNIAPPPSSSFGGGGGMSFGSSPNVLPTGGVSGFGGGRFGGSQNQNNNQYQQQQQQHQNPSSFGGAPFQSQQQSSSSSNQQSLSFGSSSNVMVGNNAPTSTGLNNDNSSGPGNSERSSGFGSDLSSKGKSNNMNNPFGGGGGGGGGGFVSSTNSPFGGGGRSATMPPTIPDNSGNVVYNRTNNNTMGDDNDHNNSNNNINPANTYVRPRTSINSAHAQMEEKKRILTAKIEEKKRRLAERQQRKKREEEESGRRSKSPTMQSASPTPPMPMRTASPKPPMRMNQPNQQQPPRTNQQQTLAERNALRFASTPSVTVRARSPITTTTTSSTSNNSTGREDLHQAVNLVGICMTMCPTDELQTRRNENDIQAMEIAMPGRLHPSNWTQQDTAVKRFRRSAADFKLDVPEWVRPPEVLEQTMGYLEEWIMERDRQGPDPRFPQPDLPPPPLDVYQFIWDRTRMIRKDFILQNYVGTGGRCDARAVRCHERIARWHAMCEHQLSHIPDFVKMQSQQNVQELGQTMKSLNGFYDDALNRSTIEVPDERTGIETYVSDQNITTNDTVQGRDPVDYNGSSLNNASDNPMIARRLIGKNSNKTIGRGTAEPEMRAIYILLTMGNEGGMEVLKYAAKLFQERPAVYHSPPVQLAISIFKAKKDSNYVKFFSIMRSSSTPYLFCCIMFKMVEEMRKYAFRVMYKAYGGRTVNGEAKYDHYPLKRLVQVLNFEDMDEARNACNHYNITVKEYEHESGEISEIIYWKGSKYREAKHPEKGHTLPLPPRKMMRTIEIKLNGTTRLGVCRGDKSGEGAALSGPAPAPVTRSTLNPNSTSFVPRNSDTRALSMTLTTDTDNEMDSKAMELLMKQKLERIKLEKQQKERKEKERRAQEERQRQENKQKEEERRLEEIERRNQAEIEKRRCEQKLKEEQARQKRLKEEEERAIQQREEEKARKIAEEKAHKEVAEARKRKELELQRQREQKEQQRRELERRLADEKRRKELEENEKRRKEEEERRLEALRLELEAKRRKEAEEKRKADEWQDKINAATKVLVWHRLRRALSRPLEIAVGSRVSLQAIDPLYKTDSFHLMDTLRMAMEENLTKIQAPLYTRPTTKSVVEEVLQKEASKLAIADMALREIESLSTTPFGSRKSTLLFKIAVICPETMDVTDQSFANLLYHWIDTRVKLGNIETAKSNANSSMEHEVRVVVVRGSSYEVCSTCDIALFIIPPKWTDPIQNAAMLGQVASSILPDDIPRVALVLSDNVEENRISTINNAIAKELGGNMETLPIIHPSQLSVEGFDNALLSAFKRVMKIFVREACVSVIRISAMQLATKTILTVLWKCVPSVSSGLDVDEDVIVECSRLALRFMMQELAKRSTHNKAEWSLWPAPEFACKDNLVESYFTKNDGLPLEWIRNLGEDFLEKTYEPLLTAFQGHFRDVYQRIVVDAPTIVQDDCATECAQGQYRRCLEKSLLWMQSASGDCYLYLPEGMIELVVNDVVSKVRANPVLSQTSTNRELDVPLLAAEDLTDDDLSFATATATATATNAPASISSNKRSRTKTQSEKDDDIRFAECTERESKKHRRQPLTTTTATNESDSFTKKLERLLRGDKTTIDDVIVGDTTLSRILRNVPEL